MKHARPLRFEALEAKQLLSTAHVAYSHLVPAQTGPLVLDGTLRVDYGAKGSSFVTNTNGSKTRSVPVGGVLGSLGRVQGIWQESVDIYGNYDGPDTMYLGNTKGTIIVSFFDLNPPLSNLKPGPSLSFDHAQQVIQGTRAYAGATETGTITLTTGHIRSHFVSLTFSTDNS